MAYDAMNTNPVYADDLAAAETPAIDGAPARGAAAAAALAYLSAAPLLAASLVVVAGPAGAGAVAAALMGLYGPALIVFFGGVRWGVAVMKPEGPTFRSLLGAALPLLVGLPLFLPFETTVKFLLIMGLTVLLLIDDLRATRRGVGAPAWYLGVRTPLTVLINVAFLVALAGLWNG